MVSGVVCGGHINNQCDLMCVGVCIQARRGNIGVRSGSSSRHNSSYCIMDSAASATTATKFLSDGQIMRNDKSCNVVKSATCITIAGY